MTEKDPQPQPAGLPELLRRDHGPVSWSPTPSPRPPPDIAAGGASVAQMEPEPWLSTSCRIRASFPGPASEVRLPSGPWESCPLPLAAPPHCAAPTWPGSPCARALQPCPLPGVPPFLPCLPDGLLLLPGHPSGPIFATPLSVDLPRGEWHARGRGHVAGGQTGQSGILGARNRGGRGAAWQRPCFTCEDGLSRLTAPASGEYLERGPTGRTERRAFLVPGLKTRAWGWFFPLGVFGLP